MIDKSKILESFGGEDFDSDLLEAFDILIDSINKEANLTVLGTKTIEFQIKQHLNNRFNITKYYSEVTKEKISKPIIVIGLPRSGTTFLFTLLSKDSENRSPLFWEMMKPLPLVKRNSLNRKLRVFKSDLTLAFKNRIIPNLDDLHAIKSSNPEECLLIKVLALQSILYFYMANTPSYLNYLSSCNTSIGYSWHKKFLRILEAQEKPQRWLLKDPSHLGNLDEILEFYPDASFVHITRDPVETIPSICSLTAQVRKGFSNDIDLKDLGMQTLQFWELSNEKNEKQRQKLSNDQYIQVKYSDLLDDPINLIVDIYKNFSLPLNDITLNKMESYIEEGSRKERAKHEYCLEDYGLGRSEVHNKLGYS